MPGRWAPSRPFYQTPRIRRNGEWTVAADTCIVFGSTDRIPPGDRRSTGGHTRDGHDGHRDPGRPRAQPPRRLARPAPRQADLLHRRQRLGQELAGVRHALCRGAAAVRREPLQLRPPVPRPDAQARGRPDRRASAPRSRSSRRPAAGTRGRTVGTITEINDYLRVLFARVGQGHCPKCDRPVAAQTREQIVAPDPRPARRDGVLRPRPGRPRPEGGIQGPLRRARPRRVRAGAGRRPGRAT